ncbi:very short patch repair endonuclease [Syntrophobacter fumaroxidans]|nr:very short patch repair endonuclease [Syntrophobacter fumaroxidans]
MADVFSEKQRSWIMSRIHGTNTKPELEVRRRLHSMGFRFRLHCSKLPGKPDIVLPKHKKAIFVHGCFWHGHQGCKRSKPPSSNVQFWTAKIAKTVERDRNNRKALVELGWQALTIWSCEIKNTEFLEKRLREFLDDPASEEK